VTGTSRSGAATLNRETMLAWDLIPDERAPFKAIIMRFASYEADHTALTDVGFSPTSSSVHALRLHDGRTAVKYAHPDGSTVVLALADPHGGADHRQERLRAATE
jgi:hypothetical protein